MKQHHIYILRTAILAILFYALILLVLYKLESKFHLPAFNHISLDAKLHFLKHHVELDTADTIIIGSSMGLNNINGVLLEDISSHVDKVVNLSAWVTKCPHHVPLLTRIVNYGNVERVIYAAQYFDFTPGPEIEGASADTVFGYLNDDPIDTFFYILTASKNIINMIDQFLRWEFFTNPKAYAYLIFDRTGGNQLDINQHNANPQRWGKVDAFTIAPFEEESLACLQHIADLSQTHAFDFYFVVQPFRKALIASNPELKEITTAFDTKTREILQNNNTHHINAHHLLNLDDSNFADKSHLNIQGANTKTKKIAEIIDRLSSIEKMPIP